MFRTKPGTKQWNRCNQKAVLDWRILLLLVDSSGNQAVSRLCCLMCCWMCPVCHRGITTYICSHLPHCYQIKSEVWGVKFGTQKSHESCILFAFESLLSPQMCRLNQAGLIKYMRLFKWLQTSICLLNSSHAANGLILLAKGVRRWLYWYIVVMYSVVWTGASGCRCSLSLPPQTSSKPHFPFFFHLVGNAWYAVWAVLLTFTAAGNEE